MSLLRGSNSSGGSTGGSGPNSTQGSAPLGFSGKSTPIYNCPCGASSSSPDHCSQSS